MVEMERTKGMETSDSSVDSSLFKGDLYTFKGRVLYLKEVYPDVSVPLLSTPTRLVKSDLMSKKSDI